MLWGHMWFSDGVMCVRVDGYPKIRFFLTRNKRYAIKHYRETYGLQHKKIQWY